MNKLFLPVTLLLSLILIFFGLFYYLFDHYVESVGIETVTAWAKNEENSIIEGNLLSSVTKAQKMLLSSEVVKGVAIFDLADPQQGPLVEFGERIRQLSANNSETQIATTGFLRKMYSIKSPSNNNLEIVFSIYSKKINSLFWVTSGVFALLTIFFVVAMFAIRRKQQIKIEKFAQKAKQAAHDLAQPIVLLNSLIQSIGANGQETIRSSVDRINNIVDDLMDKKISLKRDLKVHKQDESTFIQKVESLIEETKITSNGKVSVLLDTNLNSLDFSVDHGYMIRIFSNLIQNSLEANATHITLKVFSDDNKIVFLLKDNGSGIPEHVISKVSEENFTFGKPYGTGLGLFAAKKFVHENKGQFSIQSQEGSGTTVAISFSLSNQQKIVLTEDTKVFVLDDEEIMHYVWREKLRSLDFNTPVEYFKNTLDFLTRFGQLNRDEVFLISDFNLMDEKTGLDIIESLRLADQSALVTGQDFDPIVKDRVNRIGTRLIGKSSLNNLEIVVV